MIENNYTEFHRDARRVTEVFSVLLCVSSEVLCVTYKKELLNGH